MYKYYKIDIEKIDYINGEKAYVKVKLGFPVNTDEMSMDKMIERSGEMAEKMDEAFKKKTGKTMEEYQKSISQNDEKAMKKYFKTIGEIQLEMMDQELERITKNGKYVILELKRLPMVAQASDHSKEEMEKKKATGQVNPETKAQFNEVKGDLGFGLLLKRYTDKVVDATEDQIKQAARDTIPNVGPNFWAFRGMLAAGGLIILLTFGAFVQNLRSRVTASPLLLKALLWGLPLPFLAIEFGWFLAEYGRQPWAIYEVLPVGVSASNLSVSDLWFSIGLICVLYFFFIIVEMYLMFKYARLGPSALKTGKYYFEQSSK